MAGPGACPVGPGAAARSPGAAGSGGCRWMCCRCWPISGRRERNSPAASVSGPRPFLPGGVSGPCSPCRLRIRWACRRLRQPVPVAV